MSDYRSLGKNLKEKIYPIYEKLLSANDFENICTFAVQWGKEYPLQINKGILIIGKAVNGWKNGDQSVENLFDNQNSERIFNRNDQMIWVNSETSNTNRSAFWRVTKKITSDFYADNWLNKIAWSNLYKIAPNKGGNPNGKMQKKQREYCIELLKSEIECLKPEFVIMFTSGWESFFIEDLKKQNDLKKIKSIKWTKYETTMFQKGNTKYIVSYHPQGKKEEEHSKAILDLMKFNS